MPKPLDGDEVLRLYDLLPWEQGLQTAMGDFTQEALVEGVLQASKLGVGIDFTLINQQVNLVALDYTNTWWKQLEGNTQLGLRKALIESIEQGQPLKELENALEPLFGPERAGRIAATETTRLFAEGNRIAYAAAGIKTVEWRTAMDDYVDPDCAALEGHQMPLGGEDVVPPLHVSCRCWLSPVVDGETLTEPAPSPESEFGEVTSFNPYDAEGKARWLANKKKIKNDMVKFARDRMPADSYGAVNPNRMKESIETRINERLRKMGAKQDASEWVRSWSYTSSDKNPRSLLMQEAAAEKFGTPIPEFISKSLNSMKGSEFMTPAARQQARAVVDAIYEETQAWLTANGIDRVVLTRGMIWGAGEEMPLAIREYLLKEVQQLEGWENFLEHKLRTGLGELDIAERYVGKKALSGAEMKFFQNPLNSYTWDEVTAEKFGAYQISIEVPASRIFSTVGTGLGCWKEKEFVIIGGLDDVFFKFVGFGG